MLGLCRAASIMARSRMADTTRCRVGVGASDRQGNIKSVQAAAGQHGTDHRMSENGRAEVQSGISQSTAEHSTRQGEWCNMISLQRHVHAAGQLHLQACPDPCAQGELLTMQCSKTCRQPVLRQGVALGNQSLIPSARHSLLGTQCSLASLSPLPCSCLGQPS